MRPITVIFRNATTSHNWINKGCTLCRHIRYIVLKLNKLNSKLTHVLDHRFYMVVQYTYLIQHLQLDSCHRSIPIMRQLVCLTCLFVMEAHKNSPNQGPSCIILIPPTSQTVNIKVCNLRFGMLHWVRSKFQLNLEYLYKFPQLADV